MAARVQTHKVKLTATLIRAIVSAELPRGWSIEFRNYSGGACYGHRRLLRVPHPRFGYRALWVAFHEVAHALRFLEGRLPLRSGRATSHEEEFVAEFYASESMKIYGFPVTAVEFAEAQKNVRAWIRRDRKAGLPIRADIEQWATARSKAA